MAPRLAGHRRCAAAVAIVVCVELLGAVRVAASTTPTASPSPCGRDLAGVMCTVGSTAPGPASPRPAPSAPPPPSPRTQRSAPAAAAPAAASPTPVPTPAPDQTLAQVAAALRAMPSTVGLADVLAHPALPARPDLRHFVPPHTALAQTAGSAVPAPTPDRHAPAAVRGRGRGALAVGLVLAAVAVALVGVRCEGRRRRGWLVAAAMALVLPSSGGHASPARRPGPPAPAVAPPAMAMPPPVTAAAAPPAPAVTWARLVDIERRLDGEAVLLSAQEWEIRRLAAVTGRHRDDPDQLPVGAATGPAERSHLAALLGAHGAVAGAYHRDLEAEYDLYRTAASDPAQRAELMSGAATLRSPDAPVAVAADLGLLATQVAQETAVAEAQARLRRLAALLPTQVAAIRHHRPFLTPEVAPVSQDFGPTDLGIEPPLTYQGTFYPHFHTGIDLAADEGTPLHAAADGVVVLATSSVDAAGRLTGYGNYVVIGHAAGFLTLYGHLSEIAVHDGDRVRQGQVIGLEGSTGNSTGPHVHFEIRRDGALLDPAPFLAGQLPAS